MGATSFPQYSSDQLILLVGEGDFTFSSALASTFADARNLYATSLNAEEYIRRKYARAPNALSNLRHYGAHIIYEFDATMQSIIPLQLFHRIIFNFPHAGYFGQPEWAKKVIRKHQDLIRRFLLNAAKMIRRYDGEIHLTIQDYDPYNRWNLAKLARSCGLRLKESIVFDMNAYPGYCNRRGSGSRPGRTFPIGRGCIKTYRIAF